MTAALVLVATPIGNLGDLAPRAVEELAGAGLICCEDTRRTGRLLAHAGVGGVPLRRVDDHTEAAAVAGVVERIRAGERVARVTDAGTPGVSDPGSRLVAAVVEAGLPVTVVPGPVAAVAAVVASGLPTDRFVVEGFLPRKGRDRHERLAALATEPRTSVVYESPRRIAATLADLAEVCGPDRRAAVARELTKLHEEIVRGPLAELVEWAATEPKGELVLVLGGAPPADPADDDTVIEALRAARAAGASTRDAADAVAADLGVGRRRAYELALGIPEAVTPPS